MKSTVNYCTRCGRENKLGYNFCASCGAPLVKVQNEDVKINVKTQNDPNKVVDQLKTDTRSQPEIVEHQSTVLSEQKNVSDNRLSNNRDNQIVHDSRDRQVSLLEQFSGYFYLGGLTFIILAILAWIFLIFPETTTLQIGEQSWIAGDIAVIIGIAIILLAELGISKMQIAKKIPETTYFTSGIGFFTSLIGLALMRFETLPNFLPTLGIINNYWLIVGSGLLIGALAWIYAWRTPYKDFLFALYASAFITIDYSLNISIGTEYILLVPFLIGFSFLWIPGLITIYQTQTEVRFLGAGLLTQMLVLLRIENMQALIAFHPILLAILLLIPAFLISIVLVLKEISQIWKLILGILGISSLVVNEVAFLNTYIGWEIYSIVVFVTFSVLMLPVIKKERKLFNELMIGITGAFINFHGFLFLLGIVNTELLALIFLLVILVISNLLLLPVQHTQIRLLGMVWILPGLGAFLAIDGWIFILYGFAVIVAGYSVYKNRNLEWHIITGYFIAALPIIVLGSLQTFLDLWEVLSVPILFVCLILFYKLKIIIQNPWILIIGWVASVGTLNLLILVYPVYANFLLLEYIIFLAIAYSSYWVIPSIRSSMPGFLWLVPVGGLVGTAILNDYDPILFSLLLGLSLLFSLLIMLQVIQTELIKRDRQYTYDLTITVLHLVLFAYLIFEPVNQLLFLLLFTLLLGINLYILKKSLSYSGMDLTFAILLPAFLLIAKELIAVQVWNLPLNIEFSFLGFMLILFHSFIVAVLSRRVDEADIPLISPMITAFFANELVLLVLFVNETFNDSLALISYFLVLISGVIVIYRHRLTHIEFTLVQIITAFLGIVVTASESYEIFPIFILIPLSLPLFWLVQRLQVTKALHPILDAVVFGIISAILYFWSLRFSNDNILLVGTVIFSLQMIIGILWLIYSRRHIDQEPLGKEEFFYQSQWSLIPFIGFLILGLDLLTSSNVLWSFYLGLDTIQNLFWIWPFIFLLITIHFLLWFQLDFTSSSLYSSTYFLGIVVTLGLIFGYFQLLLASLTTDILINGLGMIILGTFLFSIAIGHIYKQKNLFEVKFNVILIGAIVEITLISLYYFLNSGLIPVYWVVIGTILILIGLFRNVRAHIGIGMLYFGASIIKVLFDFLTNFQVLTLEVAFSSSVLAIALFVIGFALNYYVKSIQNISNE